jgi:hypothetical protein
VVFGEGGRWALRTRSCVAANDNILKKRKRCTDRTFGDAHWY